MDLLKSRLTIASIATAIYLHSNMDLLKLRNSVGIRYLDCYLHSNMDLLKLHCPGSVTAASYNLHSNMDLLKSKKAVVFSYVYQVFTFQYGSTQMNKPY